MTDETARLSSLIETALARLLAQDSWEREYVGAARAALHDLGALVERQAADLERLRRIEELAAATISADTHYARVPSGPNMEILERCIAALRDEVLVAGEAAACHTEAAG